MRAIWCFGVVIPLAACAMSPVARTDAPLAVLRQQIDDVRTSAALPGISATLILPEGDELSAAAGYADIERQVPMRPTSVMPAGSIGKQFVAVVALSLEREGRLDLDRPIEPLFSDTTWFRRLPNAKALTLRLLLMHRSGIGDHRESPRFATAIAQRFEQVPFDPDFRIPAEELIAIELDSPPLFAPGADMRYSETGYLLAGLAIERACGCQYYRELERRILAPLELTATRPAVVRDVAGLAQGYIGDRLPGFPPTTLEHGVMRFSPATEWTGGGLYSDSVDLARWSRALYEGRVLEWPYLDELLARPAATGESAVRYALGVYVEETPLGEVYGHGGEFPGYLSYTAYFARSRIAIALQTNTAAVDIGTLRSAATTIVRRVLDARTGPT